MFPVSARLLSTVSDAAWSLSAGLNVILPPGRFAEPVLGAGPAAEELREDEQRPEIASGR